MRIKHRWLLLSVFVAAILIVLATRGSKPTVSLSSVTISLLDSSNDPIRGVRTALFVVTNGNPKFIHTELPYLEVEGLEDHKAHVVHTPIRTPPGSYTGGQFSRAQFPGGGYPWSFVVDKPLDSGRWRVSCLVWRSDLKEPSLYYACKNLSRLLPQPWLISVLYDLRARERRSTGLTNSSIWFTNSPSDQKEH